MMDHQTIAERYLAVWNEPDPDRRRGLLEAAWTPEGSYADPVMTGKCHGGIASMIEAARAQFPGHRFTLRDQPDGHGAHVRFSWVLAQAGAAPIAAGTDVAQLDAEGRLEAVVGFLDAVPAHG